MGFETQQAVEAEAGRRGLDDIVSVIPQQGARDILVYVSGPYSNGDSADKKVRELNVGRARRVAVALWQRGYSVVCPHLNTYDFDYQGIDYSDILEGDLTMVRHLIPERDWIVMLPNWLNSKGARVEHDEALKVGLNIDYDTALYILGYRRDQR